MADRVTSSRYARACCECANTKARCVRQAAHVKCERCRRLNKECTARPTISRAPRPRKPNRLSEVESKLDGLVTLLAASQSQLQPQLQPQLQLPKAFDSLTPDAGLNDDFLPSQAQLPSVILPDRRTPKCLRSGQATHTGDQADPGNVNPWVPIRFLCPKQSVRFIQNLDDAEATSLLVNYQTSMARFFPFVIIPSSMTAKDLRASKPFLFLSVMAVSSYETDGQATTLTTDIMSHLSEQMLLRGEKNIDLLQGILIYTAWYHSHRHMDLQLTNMLHLSIALVVDLGLNKVPYTSDVQQIITGASKIPHSHSQPSTKDEMRAYLGCFYLTSIISLCYKKIEGLRCTLHLEETCNSLAQDPEYESDVYLVQLVRLQQVAEKISQVLPNDAPQSFWNSNPPIGMLVKALQTELQSFKAAVPQNLQHDPSMLMHIHSSEIHLYEISLCDWSRQPYAHGMSNSTTSRLQILHPALLSAQAFYTTFLALPASFYSSLPFTAWAQTLHSLQVFSKLSLLPSTDVPGWDLSYLHGSADGVTHFGDLLDKLIAKFEHAREEEESLQRARGLAIGSRYEVYVLRVKRVKAWFEGKNKAMKAQVQQMEEQRAEGLGGGDVVDAAAAGISRDGDLLTGDAVMAGLDDASWLDFLGEWGSF